VAVARRLVAQHGGTPPDVERWCAGVELTASRAAFLLVNDLGAAARSLSAETLPGQPLSAKQRLKDLIAFSVSEAYFDARKMLGMGAGPRAS
jgi:hypothetical protein